VKKNYTVIGINYGGHDSSAALGVNGEILAACEQERYNKIKHSKEFPLEAINDCLKISGKKLKDIDEIAINQDYYEMVKKIYLEPALKEKNRLKFIIDDIDRIKVYNEIKNIVRTKLNFKKKVGEYRHHYCHLTSAYYPSGFKKALVVSYDGIGENESGMAGIGNNGKINIIDAGPNYPHSLGLIYSALTYYLGWKHHSDEGIIMGLAPYGNPHSIHKGKSFINHFRSIILKKKNYDYEINKDWISYHLQRDTWVSDKFIKTFGKPRKERSKIKQIHKNIAAALQLRLEEIVIGKLRYYQKKYKIDNLAISGGVGLNCSLNGKIEKSKIFKKIFIQPASGDSGTAIGAVYAAFEKKKKIKIKERFNSYLGSKFTTNEVKKFLIKKKISFSSPKNIYDEVAHHISNGEIVACFQNGAEFGPRALGNRSILCKPYPAKMKDHLNLRVKFRENFRPFAPAVLKQDQKKYFDITQNSHHMLIACKAKKATMKEIPAVIHVDNSCRVQTVSKNTNLGFYKLLESFKKLTKCSVLLNTSFNVKGQPIVNSLEDAINTFQNTNIDILFIDKFIINKTK
tara:strand:- start:4716 stop:6428 length:1713 start_codon:yes stop_codon:yes gene_type:complete